MSVILDTYPVFLFFLHFLQTYIGQPCLLSVILCTCRTNQIYNTYFLISLYFFTDIYRTNMSYVCHYIYMVNHSDIYRVFYVSLSFLSVTSLAGPIHIVFARLVTGFLRFWRDV
jgi:hypothetical protein